MPTERFYKLSEEKKERIRNAASDEFSRVPYVEASINRIIKDADISRGSFYTYFKDKMDLLIYLLQDFGEGVREFCINEMHEYNGNLFSMLGAFFKHYSNIDYGSKVMDFYKNIFSDMNMIDTWDTGNGKCLFDKNKIESFARELYENTDPELIKLNYDEFKACAEMCFAILVRGLVEEKLNQKTKQQIMNKLKIQYNIIYKGVTA